VLDVPADAERDRSPLAGSRSGLLGGTGIFAAGDVRAGSTKQAASAAGEGAAVALGIRRYVEHNATGARPMTVS